MRILRYITCQIAILRNSAENLKTISLILYEHYVNNTNHGNVFICGISDTDVLLIVHVRGFIHARTPSKKHSYYATFISNLAYGGGGMVDRYID